MTPGLTAKAYNKPIVDFQIRLRIDDVNNLEALGSEIAEKRESDSTQ